MLVFVYKLILQREEGGAMNNPSEGTSIEIVNPLNITSLIHRLFYVFHIKFLLCYFFLVHCQTLYYMGNSSLYLIEILILQIL